MTVLVALLMLLLGSHPVPIESFTTLNSLRLGSSSARSISEQEGASQEQVGRGRTSSRRTGLVSRSTLWVAPSKGVVTAAAKAPAAAAIDPKILGWAKKSAPDAEVQVSEAASVAEVLADLWSQVSNALDSPSKEASIFLFVPGCAALLQASTVQALLEHMQLCEDVCEKYGTEVTLSAKKVGEDGCPTPMLHLRRREVKDEEFAYDPFWDEGDWDLDPALFEGSDDEERSSSRAPETNVEAVRVSKEWVQTVVTDLGVCPFSVSAEKAGLPVGNVHYPITRASSSEAVYAEYWKEVSHLVRSSDQVLSTTLLITPSFGMENVEAYDSFCTTLTSPLETLKLEDDIQLVFFHPQYTFRDGQDRLGSGSAANYARRSPFPMINILRTTQVRVGQKSIPTGLVYTQNEEVLDQVGADELQRMLEQREWSGVKGKKVDRAKARVDYYATARRLQGLDMAGKVTDGGEGVVGEGEGEGGAPATKSPPTEGGAKEQEQDGASVSGDSDAASARQAQAQAKAAAQAAEAEVRLYVEQQRQLLQQQQQQLQAVQAQQQQPAATVAAAVPAPAAPAAPAPAARVGATEGLLEVEKEDFQTIAKVLVKRLTFNKPVQQEAFDDFSAAVDRVLRGGQ